MHDLILICSVIIAGMIFYAIGVTVFKSDIIMSTQWFKATIWLELISLLAIFIYIENLWSKLKQKFTDNAVLVTLFLVSFISIFLIRTDSAYFDIKPYRFYYGMNISEEEDIGLKAKNLTGKDAVFIYPVDFTGFKVYSERSAYIDFKSVVHRKDALGEWYSKIKEVYGIDIHDRRSGQNLFSIADKKYTTLGPDKLKELKGKGVDYMVQDKETDFILPVVAQNKKFKVYILK